MGTYSETTNVSADVGGFPLVFRTRMTSQTSPAHDLPPANDPHSDTAGEQRIQPRFDAPCLSVRLRARRLMGWEKTGQRVECLDINRYGTALRTDQALKPGSRILLDFRGHYITQSNVCGRVVSRVQEGDGAYRLGIQFNYCIDRHSYSRAIDNALSQIEAFCRRQMARYRR